MSNRRFGSAHFLFLTAVLGMAGSAAASAVGNKRESSNRRNSLDLANINLASLEKKLVETKEEAEGLLKIIALALGITTGAVTIGGTLYYFKDAEHRQKFLQAIANSFGKGKLSEQEIDEAIKNLEPDEEEKKDLDQPLEKPEVKRDEEKTVPSAVDDANEDTQTSADDIESLLDEPDSGNGFANAADNLYEVRNAVLRVLPLVKGRAALCGESEETLNLFDKYVMFLGSEAFGNRALYAVLKMVHLLLILFNVVLSVLRIAVLIRICGGGVNRDWLDIARGRLKGGFFDRTFGRILINRGWDVNGDVGKGWKRFAFYTTEVLKITGYIVSDLFSVVLPAYSLVYVVVQGKRLKEDIKKIQAGDHPLRV